MSHRRVRTMVLVLAAVAGVAACAGDPQPTTVAATTAISATAADVAYPPDGWYLAYGVLLLKDRQAQVTVADQISAIARRNGYPQAAVYLSPGVPTDCYGHPCEEGVPPGVNLVVVLEPGQGLSPGPHTEAEFEKFNSIDTPRQEAPVAERLGPVMAGVSGSDGIVGPNLMYLEFSKLETVTAWQPPSTEAGTDHE